jgi:hypothetical protein
MEEAKAAKKGGAKARGGRRGRSEGETDEEMNDADGEGETADPAAAAMPPPPPVYLPGGVPDLALDENLDFPSIAPGSA